MKELNYFSGEFNTNELRKYFNSLDNKELKYEIGNFVYQYLHLYEE